MAGSPKQPCPSARSPGPALGSHPCVALSSGRVRMLYHGMPGIFNDKGFALVHARTWVYRLGDHADGWARRERDGMV